MEQLVTRKNRSRSCDTVTSCILTLWHHVFTRRPPAIRHIHVKKLQIIFLVILFHSLFYSSTMSNSELCFVQIIFCVIEVGSELIKPASLLNRFPALLLYYSVITFTIFSFVYVKKLSFNSVAVTNKMQLGNGIYYSTIHYKLNMFRAVCRSSSGAPTVCAASGLHTHVVSARSLSGNWFSGDRP